MQKLLVLFIVLGLTIEMSGQIDSSNAGYTTRISSFEWMPDGNSLLLAIVKHHKTDGHAPFYSKVVLYELQSRNFTSLFDDGSSLSISPDGKTIVYLKRSEQNRTDIHFYNLRTGEKSIVKVDTLPKFALSWIPGGNRLVYNVRRGSGPSATVNICVLDLATKKVRQITNNENYKSYSPIPGPDGKLIGYYIEKGDGHDQVWLTDINGSFHKNLTNDTATHNYYPGWIDDKNIFYTQSPEVFMIMDIDGKIKRRIEDINATPVRYNSRTSKFAYIKSEQENKLMIYDWKTKISSEVLDGTVLMDLFRGE